MARLTGYINESVVLLYNSTYNCQPESSTLASLFCSKKWFEYFSHGNFIYSVSAIVNYYDGIIPRSPEPDAVIKISSMLDPY